MITGLGVVSAIGTGVEQFLTGIRTGRSGVKKITSFDTSGFHHANGCEIDDFVAADWITHTDPDDLGRASQFSAAAARMAVADAAMPVDVLRRRRVLVSVGTTDGESRELDALTGVELDAGVEKLDGRTARRSAAGRLSSGVVRELGLTDVEAVTVPTACAAGNYAIGNGFDALRAGEVDAAICGGADAVCRKTFAGFYRLGTVAPDVCQPFDRDRKGILTGEGAGMLFMESLESATERGAPIYAEVLGYALTCDASHPVAPDLDSLARCISLAHRHAGIRPEDVDFISAHGTGTQANDVTEVGAIRKAFGQPPPTISIKGMIGHTMGAASALAAAACALAIREKFIPPTVNHHVTDPECGIDCVPNEARPAEIDFVQNNALAFAGNNAVLILGRYRDGTPA
jgi:3-oxoacyl-[acyl-carrier-protein] synthase II